MKSLDQLMNLSGRVAVVTGGGGHLGSAICESLAELGASVAVVDRDDNCNTLAGELGESFNVEAEGLPVDLQDAAEVSQLCERVLKRFGRLDILVHCAAFLGSSDLKGWSAPFLEQSGEAWRLAIELNLTTPFLLTQSCANALAEHGAGSVINVSSIYAMVGPDLHLYEGTTMNNPAAYAASKGGLSQLTRWLATVMAPRVRVNNLTPGGVFRDQAEVFVRRYAERTPLGRMGTEEDFKGAAAFLASDLSKYVTGQNLVVDGGWTAW